jgi:hypothetical protein
MQEQAIRQGLVCFTVGAEGFEARFVYPVPGFPGAVVNENKWVLSRLVYHSHRGGRPIVRKRQRPRHKRVGIFDSLSDCRTAVVHTTGEEE